MATVMELLPKDYGFVAIVLVFYCFLNFYMAAQVGIARKKYKVFYPTLYASESENKDANLFNCVQRGHQNSLETMPIFFMLAILGGLKHPCVCAALGALYTVARYFYFTGYATGEPKNRLTIGKFHMVALLGLMIARSLTVLFLVLILYDHALNSESLLKLSFSKRRKKFYHKSTVDIKLFKVIAELKEISPNAQLCPNLIVFFLFFFNYMKSSYTMDVID
ncbi:Microsomal glutathione S-transferase 3, partial [Mucuna pruriens]